MQGSYTTLLLGPDIFQVKNVKYIDEKFNNCTKIKITPVHFLMKINAGKYLTLGSNNRFV